MAITSKATLKQYFETGKTPTEGQFGDLIDSMVSENDAMQAAEITAAFTNGLNSLSDDTD